MYRNEARTGVQGGSVGVIIWHGRSRFTETRHACTRYRLVTYSGLRHRPCHTGKLDIGHKQLNGGVIHVIAKQLAGR